MYVVLLALGDDGIDRGANENVTEIIIKIIVYTTGCVCCPPI